MTAHPLFDETLALACTLHPSIGDPSIPPLDPTEWYRLIGIAPAHAAVDDLVTYAREANLSDAVLRRLEAVPLLMDMACERLDRLSRRGITVITASHPDWPRRLTQRLGSSAPILLYTTGNRALLNESGLTIVGSRELTEDAVTFAQRAGRTCADQAIPVISGAAKGADRTAMIACLQEDGMAIGVLPDGLARAAQSALWRAYLESDHLLLISMEPPEAAFTARAAHCRNRVLYALGDWSLVISAREGMGGTWTGAISNMREGWSPLFVRDEPNVEAGNRALIAQGALPMTRDTLGFGTDLAAWLSEMAKGYRPLLDEPRPEEPRQMALPLPPSPALLAVWPVLEPLLRRGASASSIAAELGVVNAQARRWLREAEAAGLATRSARNTYTLASVQDDT